jgi:glycosyltransferase involved in cell wall biosynthesis
MKFSVLACVYSKDNDIYFSEAYDSVLNQALTPNEIVLVVDGPVPDKLKTSIMEFEKQARVKKIEFKIIWLQQNMGHGIARQSGLLHCTYSLVALIDADDINYVDRFKLQIDYFKSNPRVSVLGSQILEINHASRRPLSLKKVPCDSIELSVYLKTRCPFNQMSVMFKKQDVLNSGGYVDFFHNEDYYLWTRMRINGYIFANLPNVTVDARVNELFYNRRGGLKYFLSEAKLQRYMLKNGVISMGLYLSNITIRFAIQVIMPPKIRGLIFQLLFRNKL